MPDNVYAFVVSCPQLTPVTAPVEVPLAGMDPLIARRVTITIPAGHSGLTGIGVAFGHNVVLPANAGALISGDDDHFIFDLSSYPNGVSWSVFLVNGDLQSHVWQVIFEGDTLPDTPGNVAAPPPTADQVMAAAVASLGGP